MEVDNVVVAKVAVAEVDLLEVDELGVEIQRAEMAVAFLKVWKSNDLSWDHCVPGTQTDHVDDTLRPPMHLTTRINTPFLYK